MNKLGPFTLNSVVHGDSRDLISQLPDESVDILVTSPPYWGQRTSEGTGVEDDPREFINNLESIFINFLPKLKKDGIIWINIGDAYNTPVNWRTEDRQYSSLGSDRMGLGENNSAYIKPRAKRKAYIDREIGWLKYGNLLALTYRLVIDLCDKGYFYRGEVIWHKQNPMPEGRCRRPHRQHEPIYLLAKSDKHKFQTTPPVGSVWQFPNERINGKSHFSRFPEELPKRCISAYGETGEEVIVLDPFSGSGTTGLAALKLGCSYLGFEIDTEHVEASNMRLLKLQQEIKKTSAIKQAVSS